MLLINEIYTAICGESRFSGLPCTLVRLTGCHVRCVWCDSAHSFHDGREFEVAAVVGRIQSNGLVTVLITGGEPLLQPSVVDLMSALLKDGRTVLLETSGMRGPQRMVPLSAVPAGVHRIVDLKAPGSGLDESAIDWEGIALLGAQDELKAVCADRGDYEWARALVEEGRRWPRQVPVSFSPVEDSLPAKELAGWILEDALEVRLQIQLHKAIWPGVARGV